MSTSLLYHGFGIHGYRYVRTQYEGGAVIFIINQDPSEYRCSECRSSRVLRKGQITRRFRALPIGRKPVFVILAIQRVLCLACGLVRQVRPGFADSRLSYTRAFERYALELSRHMTIKDVARHLGVNWGTIKSIQKRNLKRRFSRPKLGKLKQIAIDEISLGKGHRYLTVVLDLKTGAVVYVGEGKGGEALSPFFKRLKRSKAKVEAVAMDMSPAYIRAVEDHLPGVAIVFDHFHVVKLYNEKLSDLRRQLFHQATQRGKAVLKGTRWLLLKNPENLDEGRDEQKRLQQALDLNRPLAAAYYMKEDLRRLWSFPDKESAFGFLKDWIYRAGSSGISMLRKFAQTLARHHEGILAYYDYPVSTAPLEGTNNKIKTMQRQAYGYRDVEFFKLKIMAAHEARYALVG
jgi:transposase